MENTIEGISLNSISTFVQHEAPTKQIAESSQFTCSLCGCKSTEDHLKFCSNNKNSKEKLDGATTTLKTEIKMEEEQFIDDHSIAEPIFPNKFEELEFKEPPMSDSTSTPSEQSIDPLKTEAPEELVGCNYAVAQSTQLEGHVNVYSIVSIETLPIRIKPTEKNLFKCTICDVRMKHHKHLKQHMRTHTGEKPFHCSVCNFATAQSFDLTRHMRTHSGEKPYKCPFCDYAASLSIALKYHISKHTGEKPFKCAFCDYTGTRKCDIKRHMRTHSGEKPYKCVLCDYSAADHGNLKSHVRRHTGEKRYKCTLCEYSSVDNSNLNSHLKTHTGVNRSHKCTICDYSAVREGLLKKHMMKHKGEELSEHI